MEDKHDIPTIYIKMLGQFSITVGDRTVSDYHNQARKPWELLEYLITFRGREIAPEELGELFWGDDSSVNPGNALKTLLFRSRKLLAPLCCPPSELIVQQRGSYCWSKDLHTVVDIDQFEDLCTKSGDSSLSADDRLALYREAIRLYAGDFLPKSAWESWVVPINTYYHSMYQNIAHKAIEILKDKEDYAAVIEICQHALAVEPFDEDFHYDLILSLYKNGNPNGAMEHYNRATDLFYNEFSITPSNRLKELYKTICDKRHGIVEDLTVIQEMMAEDIEKKEGAYYSEPSVFKDIYQLESRAIKRTGDSIYLCLMTLASPDGTLPKAEALSRGMEVLGEAIRFSLRRGDTYTRYSVSQYLILLPTASYENGEKVLKRIIKSFKKNCSRKETIITYGLQKMMPR